jgi:tRNA pseudouridine55 synthase
MNGLILADKPQGCTSHDIVNRIRKLAGTKRVGHLGTLDPMGTGLLALLIGAATRLAPFYERADKTYEAEIKLGVLSDTYDAEGEVTATGALLPSETVVRETLLSFQGISLQTPPPVSAKKISGVPAYKLVRKKIPVELKPVEVTIRNLEIRRQENDSVSIEVSCSSGTYIRSLAHDLGQRLGCGGLLTSLRRTRVGSFLVGQAQTLEQLTELASNGHIADALIPASQLLGDVPVERVDEAVEARIRRGQQFRTSPFNIPPGAPIVRVLSRSGELIAIGKMVIPNLYHPTTVFQPEMS